MLSKDDPKVDDERIIDRLAIVDERLLAVKRDYLTTTFTLFALFGSLGYWSGQSVPIALQTAFSPSVVVSLAYGVKKLLILQEMDQVLFS